MFSFKALASCFPMPVRSELELCFPSFTELLDAPESSVGDRFAIFDTRLIIGFEFVTTPSPDFPSCCLFGIVMDLSIDMNGCKKRWKNQNVKRTEKVVPLITGEIAFCQQVRELVFGVNAVDFGFWAKLILSNDQSDSVGSGHESHCRTLAFDDNLDHRFIAFKKCIAWLRSDKVLRL